MAISLVGVAENNVAPGSSLTVTLPTLQEDDVVYLFVMTCGTGPPATSMTTSGYSNLHDQTTAVTGSNGRFTVWRKVMGASPDGDAVINPGGSIVVSAVAVCLRGVNTSTPEDATLVAAGPTTSTNPDSPSVNTATNGAWVISAFGVGINDTSVTAPTNYGNQVDRNSSFFTVSNTVGAATREITSAGAEDPASWTNVSSGNWSAVSIAVRPEPTAPTVTNVNPNSGAVAGGTSVTITGTNFTGATSVTFGGNSATGVTVVNDTTITATTPSHVAGLVDVAVTGPGGTGTGTNAYTYVNVVQSGAGSASGTGSATATGRAVKPAAGSASGTGTATATGRAVKPAAGSASGTGTATATGRATRASPGSASGTGTATATGRATKAAAGSASGTGTATATGRATKAAAGSASGTGTATAVGTGISEAIGAAAGTGTATGVGSTFTIGYLRPNGDEATDGWVDELGGTTDIFNSIDETSANDSDYVRSPSDPTSSDLIVRLYEGVTLIATWTHNGVGTSFVTATQILTSEQFDAITDFNNLSVELDDNLGNVYRFALSNPTTEVQPTARLRYRYKKLAA